MNTRNLVLATAGLIFTAIAVVPVAVMFFESIRTPDGFTASYYSGLVGDSRQRELLSRSFVLALSTALLSTLLGAPLGFFLARTKLSLRSWWRTLLVIPLLIPPYISAIAWILARDLFPWIPPPTPGIFTLPGAALILSLSYYPIPLLVTEAALNRVEARLEEAAWLVAGRSRTLVSITLPLVTPSLIAGFLIVFVLALAEFSTPSLLRVSVFATEVYTQFAAFFDFRAATAAATPLLLIILFVAILIRGLWGERWIVTRRGFSSSPLLLSQQWAQFGKLAMTVVLSLSVLFPLISLSLRLDNSETVWRSAAGARNDFATSLALSASAALLALGLGLLLGYWRARSQHPWRVWADISWILLFTLPGTILGIGMIKLWSQLGAINIYGRWSLLLLGLVARFTPVAALLLATQVRQISISLEEAALVHGSKWWRLFSEIVVPNLKKSLVATGLLLFVLVFGELAITILLIPPGGSTLPLKIFTTITNSPDAVMAALCLFQTSLVLVPLLLLNSALSASAGRRIRSAG